MTTRAQHANRPPGSTLAAESVPVQTPTAPSRGRSVLRALLARPETSAFAGVVVVFAYFALTAGGNGFLSWVGTKNYLGVASEVGIIAIAVTLLMIAGEFDISVGSMLGASGMVFTYCILNAGWPLWAAVLTAIVAAGLVGSLTGYVVVKTGLPSFIVTLGLLFALRGLDVAIMRSLTGNTIFGGFNEKIRGDFLAPLFVGSVLGVPAEVVWWIALTLVATYFLTKRPFGNWIFATGGASDAATRAGVPVTRVKMTLFALTAMSAALVAILSTLANDASDVNMGQFFEFQTITVAVIGGTLVAGGYGTIVGTAFGALIYGMVSQGFFFTNIVTDWFQVFLGLMLVGAVTVNHYVRGASLRSRKR